MRTTGNSHDKLTLKYENCEDQHSLPENLHEFRTEFDILIYFLTAIGLSPGGRSTVHIYTQTIHRTTQNKQYIEPVAYPGILFGGGGSSTNSVDDRGQKERGSGGGSPIVRGSGGSCNLVQEISFHIVKFS